jgi:hypothetical protein
MGTSPLPMKESAKYFAPHVLLSALRAGRDLYRATPAVKQLAADDDWFYVV